MSERISHKEVPPEMAESRERFRQILKNQGILEAHYIRFAELGSILQREIRAEISKQGPLMPGDISIGQPIKELMGQSSPKKQQTINPDRLIKLQDLYRQWHEINEQLNNI